MYFCHFLDIHGSSDVGNTKMHTV